MIKSGLGVAGLVAATALAFSGAAKADDPPAFAWSMTVGGTSDYVFRGISQTAEDPAFQASVDATYGMFYAGVWGSNLEFGNEPVGFLDGGDATIEIDLYAGVKPVWGPVTFDLGVIYYIYPGARDSDLELDYVELKAGYSLASPWIKGLTTGTAVFWSPDYTNEQDEVVTVESVAAYALPQMGIFTPTISGTYGTVFGDGPPAFFAANGDDEYSYWNAGLALAVEKFTFDFRYWDTDISNAGDFCDGALFQCDDRFVFTAKVTLP